MLFERFAAARVLVCSTRRSPPVHLVRIAAAGGFAYAYHGTVDDLLGLNDSRMAHADPIKTGPKDHASFDAGVFYQLAPDILQPTALPSGAAIDLHARERTDRDPQSFDNQIFKDIFDQDRFKSTYILALVRNPADPADMVYGYFRKAYLDDPTAQRGVEVVRKLPL